jgi:ParB family transcriptional regulator, chromosome partitioning protein
LLRSGRFQDLNPALIHRSPRDIRAGAGAIDRLAESIRENGLLQPIVVRSSEDGFEVVAGNRRFEACKRLGYKSIPCHIFKLTDKEAFEISLVENIQRNTLNPIEEAEAFRQYVDGFGYGGVSELAKKIGKSQEHVSKRLQLLKLPKRVQQEIIQRRITPSTAYELCCVDTEYAEMLAEEILREDLSLREVRRAMRSYKEAQVSGQGRAPFSEYGAMSSFESRERRIERGLKQCIVSLKLSMSEFDQTIDRLDEEWITKEMLIQHRTQLHEQIDTLLQMRSKMRRNGYFERLAPSLSSTAKR